MAQASNRTAHQSDWPEHKLVFDHLDTGIGLLDEHWYFVQANKTLQKILNIKAEQLIDTKIEELLSIHSPHGITWQEAASNTQQYGSVIAKQTQDTQGKDQNKLAISISKITNESKIMFLLQVVRCSSNSTNNPNSVHDDSQKNDLTAAANYVTSLLPYGLQSRWGIDVRSRYLPSEKLGGDCFDYFWLTDRHLVIYVLDVSGHGIAPALQSVSLHNLIRTKTLGIDTMLSPAIALSELNRLFPIEKQSNYFSIWYGIYDLTTQTLVYASGGHPPALLVRANQQNKDPKTQQSSIEPLTTRGIGIGLMDDSEYSENNVTIHSGDRLFSYSDGLFEFFDHDGDIWSYDRLVRKVEKEGKTMNVHSLTDNIMSYSKSGGFDDDCSVVLVDFSGQS